MAASLDQHYRGAHNSIFLSPAAPMGLFRWESLVLGDDGDLYGATNSTASAALPFMDAI
jgi:hypothetical protein